MPIARSPSSRVTVEPTSPNVFVFDQPMVNKNLVVQ